MNQLLKSILTFFSISCSFAAIAPFSIEAFNKSINADKRVVVAVKAVWCGHCMAQQTIFKDLVMKQPYKSMSFYNLSYFGEQEDKTFLTEKYIDEYNQKHPKQPCNLASRSTILVIDENKLLACKAFITSETSIEALIRTPAQ